MGLRLRAPLALALALGCAPAFAGEPAEPAPAARRVVSLNPSLSAILLALGAGQALVGVDEYSARQQPQLAGLPTVGGLFTPSLEAVVALQPDLVVLVPGAQQRDLHERLAALGIAVEALPNIRLEDLLASIERLAARVGRAEAGRARVAEIRSEWRRVERAHAGAPRPRAVLVLQRDPLYLVGSGSFLDDMLGAAGAENLAASFAEPYPRVGLEWLLAAAPEVILDASEDPAAASDYWARFPSLPAVASGRVVALPAAQVTLPGPHPERGLRILAQALRGAPLP
jgi:iron complex transport system substrate-binding protein